MGMGGRIPPYLGMHRMNPEFLRKAKSSVRDGAATTKRPGVATGPVVSKT